MADRVDTDSLLMALRAVRPRGDGESVSTTSPPALALLDRILASPRESTPVPPAARAHQVRRPVAVGSVAAAVIACVAGGVALDRDTGTARQPASGPFPSPRAAKAATMRLAGYSFTLPAGYTASNQPCDDGIRPSGGGTAVSVSPPPVVGGDSFASAASADGGCIEASLGTGHPGDAEAVHFGSYAGYIWRTKSPLRGDLLTLYVELPPSASAGVGMDPGLNLYLDSTGLTPTQLEAIAASGLGN